jgi:hypothetical protein
MSHTNSPDEKQEASEIIERAIVRWVQQWQLTNLRKDHDPGTLAFDITHLLAEAGYKIVLREPSEAMSAAGGNCGGFEFDGESGTIWPSPIWRAMWDAAE